MMAVLLVYSHRRQGFSSANTLKFWPARPSASGLPPAMRLSFLLGISDGAGAPKLMLHRLDDVCSTADCTCGTTTGSSHMFACPLPPMQTSLYAFIQEPLVERAQQSALHCRPLNRLRRCRAQQGVRAEGDVHDAAGHVEQAGR